MNQEILIFGDFNIDTLKDERVQRDYKNLLNAYNLGLGNFEPTRVTPTSKNVSIILLQLSKLKLKHCKRR